MIWALKLITMCLMAYRKLKICFRMVFIWIKKTCPERKHKHYLFLQIQIT